MSATEWHGYRLVQDDLWFFRDGSPSIAGADHYLRSIFPPFPSTVYGLVRTQQLIEAGVDLHSLSQEKWRSLPEELRKRVGEWGAFGTLRLRGPWILRCDDILLPAPLDLGIQVERAKDPSDDRVTQVLRLLPTDHVRGSCNWSHGLTPMLPFALEGGQWIAPRLEIEPESSAGWLITVEGMRKWTSGGVPECDDFVPPEKVWTSEVRTGVGLDARQRMHEEHQLYTFGFVRMRRGVSLGFELSGGTVKVGRAARFGGENRVARIESGPMLSAEFATTARAAEEGSVTTLITAGIFPDGAIPAKRTITGAVAPGPLLSGGWDIAKRRPKVLHRAAPPGSVYWIDGEAPPLLDSWSEKAEEGFGLMLSGRRPRRNKDG